MTTSAPRDPPASVPPPVGPVRVLIVEDDDVMRRAARRFLSDPAFEVATAGDGEGALELVAARDFDVVVADVIMPRLNGLELLRRLRELGRDVEVIMMTAHDDLSLAFEAVQAGAFHFLKKPFSPDELRLQVMRASERQRLFAHTRRLEAELDDTRGLTRALGTSRAMREVREAIGRMASQHVSVLITGENGTGKEVVAREIHARSPRHRGPFVPVNCGALTETLVESLLFGSVKGAYSGAEDRAGYFEAASGGTIFLDEVGELPKAQQVKFLRVLQERKVNRVGEVREREVNVRVVAATNVDLKQAVAERRFREDLFYRLAVQRLHLPPLRDRREDIQLLAYHFLQKHGPHTNAAVTRISPVALRALEAHAWPGNVRELESAIVVGLGAARTEVIELDCLPAELRAVALPRPVAAPAAPTSLNYQEARRKNTEAFERAWTTALLEATQGNVSRAAILAGLDRANLRRILRRVKATGATLPAADEDDAT